MLIASNRLVRFRSNQSIPGTKSLKDVQKTSLVAVVTNRFPAQNLHKCPRASLVADLVHEYQIDLHHESSQMMI